MIKATTTIKAGGRKFCCARLPRVHGRPQTKEHAPMRNHLWTILYAGWLAAVLWLSLDPSPPGIDIGPLGWDKFQHAAGYGVMTILGGLGLRQWIQPAFRRWPASAAIAVFIGILVEVAQGLMKAGRFPEWQDAAANALGAMAALLLVALVCLVRRRAGS
jgi:VanZ family protein